jgi:hypothetical protein
MRKEGRMDSLDQVIDPLLKTRIELYHCELRLKQLIMEANFTIAAMKQDIKSTKSKINNIIDDIDSDLRLIHSKKIYATNKTSILIETAKEKQLNKYLTRLKALRELTDKQQTDEQH